MENQVSWSGMFSQDTKTLQILKEIQDWMTFCQRSPEEFEDRIIFMFMVDDIDWIESGNSTECCSNSVTVKFYRKDFRLDIGLFLLHEKKNGMDRTSTNLKESGTLPQTW